MLEMEKWRKNMPHQCNEADRGTLPWQQFFVLVLLLLLQIESNCFAARFLQSANVTAVEGSPMDFICESDNREPIEECIFLVHGFYSKIKIFEGVINQNYEFIGEGFPKGQCGLRLLSIKRKNTGKVTCRLEMMDMKQEAQTDVTVLYPIDELKITSNNIYYEYKENEQMEFNCTAEGGFPAPVLSLHIGDHQILNSTSNELIWKGPAQIENNGRRLVCCADQHNSLLPRTHTNCGNRMLSVFYSPRMYNGLHEVEVPVVMRKDAIVTVKILANPLPNQYELTKNGEIQDAPILESEFSETTVVYTWKLVDIKSDWRFFSNNHYGNNSVLIKLIPQIADTTATREDSPRMKNGLHLVEVPVVLGQDANVTVDILANPSPHHFELTKNGQEKAHQLIEYKVNRTDVVYTWTMMNVQLDDIQSIWSLFVDNYIGNTTIFIKLNVSTETSTNQAEHEWILLLKVILTISASLHIATVFIIKSRIVKKRTNRVPVSKSSFHPVSDSNEIEKHLCNVKIKNRVEYRAGINN